MTEAMTWAGRPQAEEAAEHAVQRVDYQPARVDPEAWARAEAIRAESDARIEGERQRAEAEAEAIRIKAGEDAERQRISNQRAAMKLERDQAEHAVRLAELKQREEAALRDTQAESKAAEEAEQSAVEQAELVERKAKRWRHAAKGFWIICLLVALPVQMHAFWNPRAPWMLAGPIFLESGAWVVLQGADAAVTERRAHWHYRLIAWGIALIAAAINLAHGWQEFGAATAVGTALASIAGPGVWDLHEHGRIIKRDGKPTWRQRRAQRGDERVARAERAAAEQAARARHARLAAERKQAELEVWKRAKYIAAAVGDLSVTDEVWARAWHDIKGAPLGETAETIRARNAAVIRTNRALADAPATASVKTASQQVAAQMPPRQKKGRSAAQNAGPKVRGVRRRGDTPRYSRGARKQMREAALDAADRDRRGHTK